MSETEGEWHIEGVARCPRCRQYFDLNGPLPELGELIATHECAKTAKERKTS